MSFAYNKKDKPNFVRSKTKDSVKSPLQLPYANMPERGITQDTCKLFGVRMSVSPETGQASAYYFPYYDQRGNLTGWKVRDLTKDKYDDFHFTTIGKVGVECQLFGQNVANKSVKTVFLCEGELDAMACAQVLIDGVKNTKWSNMLPSVVSLSCGTANGVEAVMHNEHFVKGYQNIVLCFDNDSATEKEYNKGIRRGKEATDEVAGALMSDCVSVIQYPDGFKDPTNFLEEGKGEKLRQLLLSKGTKYTAEKIVLSSQYTLDEVYKPKPQGVMIEAFPKLSYKLKGFRKREMTIVTALAGAGKSSVVSEVAFELGNAGHRVGMIFLEEEDKETIQRLSARYLKINYNKFKFDPFKQATREQLQEAKDWVDDKYVFLDHFGSLKTEILINKIRAMMAINKVDFIILDHLSMVVSGLATTDERKLVDMVMTELAAFTASHDVGLIVVSHLNREGASDMRNIKAKEEPFWVRVRKEDLRSSASIEQLAWVVLGIEAEVMPDRSRGRVRLTVLKNRPTGWLGEADTVKMDEDTGLFYDASDETLFTEIG